MLYRDGEEWSVERAVLSVLDSYSEDRYGIVNLLTTILERMPEPEAAAILTEAHKCAAWTAEGE